MFGAIAVSAVIGPCAEMPLAYYSGGVSFGFHTVEDGDGVGRQSIDVIGSREIVDIIFVANPLLVRSRDNGGTGWRADRGGVGIGEESSALT